MRRCTIVEGHKRKGKSVKRHVRCTKGSSVSDSKPGDLSNKNDSFSGSIKSFSDNHSKLNVPDGFSADDIISLTGFNSNEGNISYSNKKGIASIEIESGGTRLKRTIDFNKKVINNEVFISDGESGTGTKIFKNQVDNAQRLGFKKIETYGANAIDGEPANGFYTWPRLGYETKNKAGLLEYNSYDKNFKGIDSFHDLMSTSEGRNYWLNEGRYANMTFEMEFDLSKNSKSVERLNNYYKERFN